MSRHRCEIAALGLFARAKALAGKKAYAAPNESTLVTKQITLAAIRVRLAPFGETLAANQNTPRATTDRPAPTNERLRGNFGTPCALGLGPTCPVPHTLQHDHPSYFGAE